MKHYLSYIVLMTILLSACSTTMNGDLHLAVKQSDFEGVKHEVEVKKGDVNAKGVGDITPLMYAKNSEIAQYLIDKGADVNAQNVYGTTPLMMKINGHNIDVAKLLIENGADVNLQNNKGETALFDAYVLDAINGQFNGDRSGVDLLMQNNIDSSIRNKSGKTAEETAIQIVDGHTMIMPLLIKEKKQIKPSNGVLQYSFSNEHIKDQASKFQNDLVSTYFVIKNVDTGIWYKFSWRNGQVSLPSGKYQLVRVYGRLFNSKQNINHVYFADAEKLYLGYLPAAAVEKATFTVKDSMATCINVFSETMKLDNSNSLITAAVFGFSFYKFETGCNNAEGLLASENTDSRSLVQYGFDNSVNFDYVKLQKDTDSSVFYLLAAISLDLISSVGEDDEGRLRIIPNFNNNLAETFKEYLNKNGLISQNDFFHKYLLKTPENYIN